MVRLSLWTFVIILLTPVLVKAMPQKHLLGQHAQVISKMVGSSLSHGQASDLRCTWSEASVEDGKQECTFLNRNFKAQRLTGIKASFMIDSVLGAKTAKANCVAGGCQFSGPQELVCYTLGPKAFALQCRITASN